MIDFLTLQFFINLLTWPLFLCWGLSITPLSILGNLIFSPFLTAFLLLASLITVGELIGISTTPLLWLIELLTTLWLKLASCYGADCSVAFAQPSLLLALCVPICTITIMVWSKITTSYARLIGLCSVYIIFATLFCLTRTPEEVRIPYGTNHMTLKKQKKKITLFDSGFIRRTGSITTWINYTFLPALAKNFGVQAVDTIIIEKQNPSAIRCAQLLQQKGYTREVVYKK